MKKRALRVAGTGMTLPGRPVTAREIDARAGLPEGWTAQHSGVLTRHFSDGESAIQLGARAVTEALRDAGLKLEDLDAIVSVSGTMHQPIPSNAALLAGELGPGTEGMRTFDINSTCLGFLTGMDLVSAQLAAGSFRRAVLVASELASVGLDWTEAESCSILGDGAAAVIIEAVEPEAGGIGPGVAAAAFGTWARGAALTEIRGGGSGQPAGLWETSRPADYLFHMDGRAVFKLAAELLPDFVRTLFSKHGFSWQDFDLIIPHQASLTSLALLRRRLGIPEERFMIYAQDYGNTIAASIPMGLHLAMKSGRVKGGSRVLMIGTSAGFSLGALVLDL